MIGSLLPIFLLIDGPKTGLRLLNAKAGGKPIVPIVVERRSLVNLYRISMQKDSYEYGGTHFLARESCICNEENPLFARESKLVCGKSKGSPKRGLSLTLVDY